MLGEQLLWVVVDELPVNKDIWLIAQNPLDLVEHFALFGLFDLGHLLHGADFDLASHYLDFVVVHRCVGHHNTGVCLSFAASRGDCLLEDEALGEERVTERASGLLNDLDIVKVSGALQSEDGLDSQISKVVSVVEKQLRR